MFIVVEATQFCTTNRQTQQRISPVSITDMRPQTHRNQLNPLEYSTQEIDRIHSVMGLVRNQDGQCTAQPKYIRPQAILRGADLTSYHYQKTHTSEISQPTGPCNTSHCGPHRQANKKPWPNWHHITLQPTIPTRCHTKAAIHIGKPSEYFCTYHHRYPIKRGHWGSFHHWLY